MISRYLVSVGLAIKLSMRWLVRDLKRYLVLVPAVILWGCAEPEPEAGLVFPNKAPSHKAHHYTYINYWAEWCAPCLKEIPELNTLASKHSDTISVYAVNFDGIEGQELTDLAAKFDIQFNVLEQDPLPVSGYPRPVSLPVTWIFNAEGKALTQLKGAQTLEELEAWLPGASGAL